MIQPRNLFEILGHRLIHCLCNLPLASPSLLHSLLLSLPFKMFSNHTNHLLLRLSSRPNRNAEPKPDSVTYEEPTYHTIKEFGKIIKFHISLIRPVKEPAKDSKLSSDQSDNSKCQPKIDRFKRNLIAGKGNRKPKRLHTISLP